MVITLIKLKSSSLNKNKLFCKVCDISLQGEIEEMKLYGFTFFGELAAKNVCFLPLVCSSEQEKFWG